MKASSDDFTAQKQAVKPKIKGFSGALHKASRFSYGVIRDIVMVHLIIVK